MKNGLLMSQQDVFTHMADPIGLRRVKRRMSLEKSHYNITLKYKCFNNVSSEHFYYYRFQVFLSGPSCFNGLIVLT